MNEDKKVCIGNTRTEEKTKLKIGKGKQQGIL
jgi:hypothetical protein